MKSNRLLITLVSAISALCLPLAAEREFTATWDKHPEKAEILILANGIELGRTAVDPSAAPESIKIMVPDGEVTITAVAMNAVGERSDPSAPFVIPARPSAPRGVKITIQAVITVSPTP